MILKCLGTNAVNSLSNSGYAKCTPVPARVLRAFELPAMLCQWCWQNKMCYGRLTIMPGHLITYYHTWPNAVASDLIMDRANCCIVNDFTLFAVQGYQLLYALPVRWCKTSSHGCNFGTFRIALSACICRFQNVTLTWQLAIQVDFSRHSMHVFSMRIA